MVVILVIWNSICCLKVSFKLMKHACGCLPDEYVGLSSSFKLSLP